MSDAGAHDAVDVEAQLFARAIDAYAKVVLPEVDLGLRPLASSFAISVVAARALNEAGLPARVVRCSSLFQDLVHDTTAISGSPPLDMTSAPAPIRVGAYDASLGHAVVATANHILDLTIRQFDHYEVAPRVLFATLPDSLQHGELVEFSQEHWVYDIWPDDTLPDLGVDLGGLAGTGLDEAFRGVFHGTHAIAPPKRPDRNSPCPCGSGRKAKHCHQSPDGPPRPFLAD